MATYSLIYEPKGRAREYAALACNVYRGCDHRCIYCYAPNATQRTQADFAISETRGGDFLARLAREASKRQAAGLGGSVLLSFTCDPYQTLDTREAITRQAIQILHSMGHDVQILTKGGTRSLRDLDLFTSADAFATTMTFLDDGQSLEWEPGAALPLDRIAAINAFHSAGIPTWVSLEPVINPAISLEIIRQTHSIVDLFKVGKMNYHPIASTISWQQFGMEAIDLLRSLGKRFYIKRDLAVFLLPGYESDTEPVPEKREAQAPQLAMF